YSHLPPPHISTLSLHDALPILRDVRNASLAWTNVRFPETNYYGDASIYNEALQERIMDTNSLAEFLGISDVEEMYTVSLSAEEKEQFLDDYNLLTFDHLESEYDLQVVEPEGRSSLSESINAGNLDADGGEILLYRAANTGAHNPENEEGTYEAKASETHIILGID